MDLRSEITNFATLVLNLDAANVRIAELEAENKKLRAERDPWRHLDDLSKRNPKPE